MKCPICKGREFYGDHDEWCDGCKKAKAATVREIAEGAKKLKRYNGIEEDLEGAFVYFDEVKALLEEGGG